MTEPTMAELSEAFSPATTSGLAAELWALNCDISDLNKAIASVRARRDHVADTLLKLMQKCGIESIDGQHPRLSIVDGWDYDLYKHEGYPKPVLEFAKGKRDDA